MHSSTLFVLASIAIVVLGIIISCYQSTIQTPVFLVGLVLKLIVRDVYPALDNPNSLATVRNMINSQGGLKIPANQTVLNIDIVGTADQIIPARLYIPAKTDASSSALQPVLIWYHGGGFVFGNYTNEDPQCTTIAEYTNFIVVNVDYRLAPEDKFPAGVTDALDALQWTKKNILQYGGDPDRILISGESAGGAIAAAVTAMNYDTALTDPSSAVDTKGLLVLYPCLEHGVYRDSHFRYSETFAILTLKQMIRFWGLYLTDQAKESQDYRACPMRTPKSILQRFPPTVIALAKHDVLLDEGLAFGTILHNLNVPVKTIVYDDVYHGFFAKGASSKKEQTNEILDGLLQLSRI